MAIDTSMYAVDLTPGEYKEGQIIPLSIQAGASVVRDGYGSAILKKIRTGALRGTAGNVVPGYFVVRNSNWVDPIVNAFSSIFGNTALANDTQGVQPGNDAELQVNSSWSVEYVVTATVTTTLANSLVATIDIDYPSVSAIFNPAGQVGQPASTVTNLGDIKSTKVGAIDGSTWQSVNVDILKAGYRYLLQKVGVYIKDGRSLSGFIAFSGAASMGGLSQIIPFNTDNAGSLKPQLDYSVPLVKGPMAMSVVVYTVDEPAPISMFTILDWVKR